MVVVVAAAAAAAVVLLLPSLPLVMHLVLLAVLVQVLGTASAAAGSVGVGAEAGDSVFAALCCWS